MSRKTGGKKRGNERGFAGQRYMDYHSREKVLKKKKAVARPLYTCQGEEFDLRSAFQSSKESSRKGRKAEEAAARRITHRKKAGPEPDVILQCSRHPQNERKE